MSEQPKDTNYVQIRWIPKYTFIERFLHWVHTASFVPLVADRAGAVPALPAGAGAG